MATGLVLDDTARVKWITIGTLWTESDGRAIFPHLANTTIVCAVGHDDDERLIQVAFCYGRSVQRIIENLIIIGTQTYTTGISSVEAVVADSIHRAYARFR